MSDYFDLIQRRESCRNFDPNRPVEKEKLRRCAEAAWIAPSACNGQPWKYLIVTNAELSEKLRPLMMELGMNKFVKNCPAFAVVLEENTVLKVSLSQKFKDQDFAPIDVAFSASQFCYAATEQGLSTCIIGWHNEQKIRELFGLPKSTRVRLILAVGYAANDTLREKKRKPIDDVIKYYE
ncbi:MAG: nitroreductase family protein [Eubacteriales bacterium]|jgi:nitroreductase|nr:nitroreductase family protein [Eubacteriales bacterium]